MWLILSEILRKMESAQERAVEVRSFDQRPVTSSDREILVRGVLTQEPDFFAEFFGGGNTLYPDIIAALTQADSDNSIKTITMRFNTPGGNISGLLETIKAIKATTKPVVAIIDDMALSAGFALASQADSIIAVNELASVGSIGVVIDAFISEHEISITNRDSPDKRPDLTTDEGKAIVQDRLDAIHKVILSEIETGRGQTVDFGEGRVFLADEARTRGLIDGFEKHTEVSSMDLEELKAKHPTLYAQVVNESIAKGITQGVTQERDRVHAHMTSGAISPQHLKIATKAIEEGTGWTAGVQAEYMAATASKKEIENRMKEDADPGNPNASGKDNEDQIADMVAAAMGGE